MEWMLMPLKRYADFSGRSRRKEYWMFTLFTFLVGIVAGVLGILLGGTSEAGPNGIFFVLVGIPILALLIPSIAVTVRRFHDQDKSGWFYLLALIPYVGGIIVLVFMCLEGTRGPNRFGPDPKQAVDDVFN